MESRPTIMESQSLVTYPQVHHVLDLVNSELESADSSSDSDAEAPKVGVWVWTLKGHMYNTQNSGHMGQNLSS